MIGLDLRDFGLEILDKRVRQFVRPTENEEVQGSGH